MTGNARQYWERRVFLETKAGIDLRGVPAAMTTSTHLTEGNIMPEFSMRQAVENLQRAHAASAGTFMDTEDFMARLRGLVNSTCSPKQPSGNKTAVSIGDGLAQPGAPVPATNE